PQRGSALPARPSAACVRTMRLSEPGIHHGPRLLPTAKTESMNTQLEGGVVTPPRQNYIFVDYENTQGIDLGLIAGQPVMVFLILGGGQGKLSKELLVKVHKYSAQLHIVETEQTGNQALDLVLACQIGVQSVADPNGYFHI